MGMAGIAHMSCSLGFCTKTDADRLIALIRAVGLPTALPRFSAADYVDTILKDKKKTADTLKMVMMKGIGTVLIRPTAAHELHELLAKEIGL
jgi:3-dehydroquinate synthase